LQLLLDFSETPYTLPLLKMLERALSKDLDSLYELLRDILLAWEFVDSQTELIVEISHKEIVKRALLKEKCEAWLR